MEDNQQSAVYDGQTEEAANETLPQPTESDDALEQLTAQKAELEDRLLRLTAEFDNFRKRSERERADFAAYAGEQVVRALLPILDDFERALKVAPTGGQKDEFVRGVELIYNRLLETLKKQGLEPINTTGAIFDPHRHEAIQRLETDEYEEGTIVQEFQRGYDFKGRLLRPAMVQVAVKS